MPEIDPLLTRVRGGLIVSCQPEAEGRESDPMNSPVIMAALARPSDSGWQDTIRPPRIRFRSGSTSGIR